MEIDALNSNNGYRQRIESNINNCLTLSKIDFPMEYQGKVRDRYDIGNAYALITTDRQSAFDRILASIPYKGQALNQISSWWFRNTSHIIKNHEITTPDPNVTIAQKARPFPIEFIVRGYITGSSNTSLWTHYETGKREYCGITLPDGLKKNSRLEFPIVTPTTKESNHDRPISPMEIIADGWMSENHWNESSQKALELFRFGQKTADKNGLVLVDTKYEMGLSHKDEIIVIDEIHTPDSSRYWISKDYEERIASGNEPQNIDKEFLRLWFKKHCDPYNDRILPQAPKELIVELSLRYIYLYEKITGGNFQFDECENINKRINENMNLYLNS
ncbi:MAG: phosphoribosylaminoimidazolesuccinocarboxamide synthase [Verrucomicrobia bacterium TMED44]|nr:MAG: phosphoribosylaminoimidazolesuccinocarboxamide synthase [Verrucomicrobia bacterium TMED44]